MPWTLRPKQRNTTRPFSGTSPRDRSADPSPWLAIHKGVLGAADLHRRSSVAATMMVVGEERTLPGALTCTWRVPWAGQGGYST